MEARPRTPGLSIQRSSSEHVLLDGVEFAKAKGRNCAAPSAGHRLNGNQVNFSPRPTVVLASELIAQVAVLRGDLKFIPCEESLRGTQLISDTRRLVPQETFREWRCPGRLRGSRLASVVGKRRRRE
jgi:hypothetical protein